MTAQSVQKAVVAPDHLPVWDDPREALFKQVTIVPDQCDGCKLCAVVCPANVLEMFGPRDNLKVRLKDNVTGCMSCNNCLAVCVGKGVYATEPYDFAGFYEQKRIGAFEFPRKF